MTTHRYSALEAEILRSEISLNVTTRKPADLKEGFGRGVIRNTCVLSLADRSMRVTFYQGSIAARDYPQRVDILRSLFMTYRGLADYDSYYEYQDSPEYDEFQIKLKTFEAAKKETNDLRNLLGELWDFFYKAFEADEEF